MDLLVVAPLQCLLTNERKNASNKSLFTITVIKI